MEEINPKRAIAIVAHPDDIEYYCGGTIAKWIRQGCKVSYLIASSGDKGSNNLNEDLAKLIKTREAEQLASARVLGVDDIIFLRYPDAELSFVSPDSLRSEFVRHIRRTQAEVVLTHDPLVRTARQHPDHRVVGELARDASFPISAITNCYQEQITHDGLSVCQPNYILFFGTDAANYFVDIEGTLELKILALQAHGSQQSAFAGGIEDRLRWKASTIGALYGLSAAEEFLLMQTGPQLPT